MTNGPNPVAPPPRPQRGEVRDTVVVLDDRGVDVTPKAMMPTVAGAAPGAAKPSGDRTNSGRLDSLDDTSDKLSEFSEAQGAANAGGPGERMSSAGFSRGSFRCDLGDTYREAGGGRRWGVGPPPSSRGMWASPEAPSGDHLSRP